MQPEYLQRYTDVADPENGTAPILADLDKHGFLYTDDLKCLPSEDIQYLSLKKSLSIPASTQVFVESYFKKIHPMLPVLDEMQFWRAFGDHTEKISIFVFQALMFASAPFVCLETLRECGFEDKRDAHKQLYIRAKLLFDLKVELKPSAKAQGALLLTHHSSAAAPLAGSLWLTSSIENAILIDAQPSLVKDPVSDSMKKRLWWSILLRDRSLCIGLRRRPQVTSINLHGYRDWLQEEDFEDEMHHSKVYDYQTKARFLSVLQEQCKLAIILTDLASLIFNPRLTPTASYSNDEFETHMDTLKNIKESLVQWHSQAQYPPGKKERYPHASTALQNLTFMIYHTAMVDLAQYAGLLIEEYPYLPAERYQRMIRDIGRDLKSGIDGLTPVMEYFSLTGHVDNLPLSVLAYVGMPLVLAAIDLKLSPSRSEVAARQKRLDSLSRIIRHSESLYDVTDFVAAGTNHILQLAYVTTQNCFLPREISSTEHSMEGFNSVRHGNVPRELSKRSLSPSHSRAKNWLDAFLICPRGYLLISTSVDYSLSVGRLPYDSSLPALVRDISNQFSMSRLPWSVGNESSTYQALLPSDERAHADSKSNCREMSSDSLQDSHLNNGDDRVAHEDRPAADFQSEHQEICGNEITERGHNISSHRINLDFFDLGSDQIFHSVASPSERSLSQAEDTCSLPFGPSQHLLSQLDSIGRVMDFGGGEDGFDSARLQSVFHALAGDGNCAAWS
ncbi:Transcription factor [Penicillium lividum]|nr:Transcription factor [Penicillium lividum]